MTRGIKIVDFGGLDTGGALVETATLNLPLATGPAEAIAIQP